MLRSNFSKLGKQFLQKLVDYYVVGGYGNTDCLEGDEEEDGGSGSAGPESQEEGGEEMGKKKEEEVHDPSFLKKKRKFADYIKDDEANFTEEEKGKVLQFLRYALCLRGLSDEDDDNGER